MQTLHGASAFLLSTLVFLCAEPSRLAAQSTDAGNAAITVGGITLSVPAPAGTRAVARTSSIFRTVESALPPMLRLEGSFYGTNEASLVENGVKPASGPFFQIQINKTFEGKRFSSPDFASLRGSMRRELADSAKMTAEAEKALGEGSKRIAKSTGVDVKLNPGQSVFLEPHLDEPAMLGFSFRMGFQISAGGSVGVDEEMSGTCVMAHVRGKAVQLYAYHPGSSAEALESSRRTAREWADAVLAANPVQSSDHASSFGFDWSRMGEKAGIGAGIGAIVGVLAVLFKRKKSAA